MAFAGFLHTRRLRDVPLLTARRRQRRVVRCLRRLAVLGLELGDAGQQRLVLHDQLVNARREPADLLQQLQHQWLHVVRERINLLRRHASLNQLARKNSTRTPESNRRRGVSNYVMTGRPTTCFRPSRAICAPRQTRSTGWGLISNVAASSDMIASTMTM